MLNNTIKNNKPSELKLKYLRPAQFRKIYTTFVNTIKYNVNKIFYPLFWYNSKEFPIIYFTRLILPISPAFNLKIEQFIMIAIIQFVSIK